MRLFILLLAAALWATAAHAEVYRYTDENGNVVYTDEPRGEDQAEKITVRKIPIINMPDGPLTEQTLQQRQKKQEPTAAYQRIAFTEPANDSAFWSGSGNIALTVQAEPPLRPTHQFEVLLDGEPLGRNAAGVFTVQHIDRGTHTASVRVVNGKNNLVQSGESVTFTVHRPSVLN